MGKKKSIESELKEFKKKLNKDYPVDHLILFGSTATGKATKDSDIDLIIVSKKFKKLNFMQRGAKMYNYWTLRKPVDFICYTPEEFNKRKNGVTIVKQALKEGKEI